MTKMQEQYIPAQEHHVQNSRENISFKSEKGFCYGSKVDVVKEV